MLMSGIHLNKIVHVGYINPIKFIYKLYGLGTYGIWSCYTKNRDEQA